MFSDAKCTPDIAKPKHVKKLNTFYFGSIIIWDVLTKIGPYRDVLGILFGGWVCNNIIKNPLPLETKMVMHKTP